MKTKQLILSVGLMLITMVSFAGKPPVSVQKAFEARFPGSTHVSWMRESPVQWEAFFTYNGAKIAADFTKDGVWLETETEVSVSELPGTANKSLGTAFPGWSVEVVNKVENANHLITYVTDICKGLITKVVAFKEDGTIIGR